MKKQEYRSLDRHDTLILREVAEEGRLPVTELAKRVGLSKSPCQVRLKRLETEGFIRGYRADIDHAKLGNAHIAFVEIKLLDTKEAALAAFNSAVLQIAEVESCYLIAGSYDYLLKVRTPDISAYRRVLAEHIAALPHVANSSTYVAMQEIIDRSR